ncbi:hypothetical protein TrRE_jg7231 [Triparma retinervis]|uniref:Chlorophyll A-B binding protein n=1 Tax=Triparma retinervis TaxID=2557542 RepID=A0A9W7F948_9STRA|nr:hypothetical protein TrRE_jg7231 [Triparma retinervis]
MTPSRSPLVSSHFSTCHLSTSTSSPNTITQIFTSSKSTHLNDRQWNFNDGRAPWGMKNNAEIWNGRVAQVAFTIVLLQELVFGKGVVQGVQDGDLGAIFMLGITGVSVLGLTGWLALKGNENDIKY